MTKTLLALAINYALLAATPVHADDSATAAAVTNSDSPGAASNCRNSENSTCALR